MWYLVDDRKSFKTLWEIKPYLRNKYKDAYAIDIDTRNNRIIVWKKGCFTENYRLDYIY